MANQNADVGDKNDEEFSDEGSGAVECTSDGGRNGLRKDESHR